MKDILQVTYALLATSALICLCAYIWHAFRGDSALLYSTSDQLMMTFWKKVFFALSAIGLFTCMFQGAEAMLWWLPSSWGVHDEDGDFTSRRIQIAALIALLAGGALVVFAERSVREAFALKQANIENQELERILAAFDSIALLENLVAGYRKEIDKTSSALHKKDGAYRSARTYVLPEGKILGIYERLHEVATKRLLVLREGVADA